MLMRWESAIPVSDLKILRGKYIVMKKKYYIVIEMKKKGKKSI